MGPQVSGDYASRRTHGSLLDNSAASEPLRRPGVLTAAVACIVAAAVSGIGSLLVVLSGGKEMLRPLLEKTLEEEAGGDADLVRSIGGELLEAGLAEAYDGLTSRAYIITFVAVVFLLCGAFIALGRNWARITFIPFALLGLLFWLVDLADGVPAILHVFDGIALVGTLVALVMIWLGPVNRYMKARKLRARA